MHGTRAPGASARGWTEFSPGYPAGVNTADRFWTRRLRWRLLGAWRWPLFVALTVADGFIAQALPPTGGSAQLVPSMIIASFSNLFLIGLVAPWLARRLAA